MKKKEVEEEKKEKEEEEGDEGEKEELFDWESLNKDRKSSNID